MRHRVTARLPVFVSLCLAAGLAACGDDSAAPPAARGPSIEFINVFQPVDLTPDGSIALMQQYNARGEFYFYRTETGSLELKGEVGDASLGAATAISAGGVVTAFHGSPQQAGIWTEQSGWTDIPSVFTTGCGTDVASAWDLTANGRIVVGMAWDECGVQAFKWDATGSGIMTLLERLGSQFPGSTRPPDNRATVVSDDGSVIAGWASTAETGRYPAVWREDGTGFLIQATVEAGTGGEVMATSGDGKYLAGYLGENAFYWTQAGGVVSIGKLPPADEFDFGGATANAITDDGKLIFGVSGQPFFGTPKAFVWTQAAGMRLLADVVQAAGLTIPEGTTLTNVLASSTDGTVILGQATLADYSIVCFVLRLPISAYGL
jgi:uncharacterized membrane protein